VAEWVLSSSLKSYSNLFIFLGDTCE